MVTRNKKLIKISEAYKRWRIQLKALHQGELKIVKRIADQARRELETKTRIRQMNLLIN